MSLKTDYKNDKFSGARKYRKTDNDDGTISLEDVTVYEETGDVFGAADINATNEAVNKNTTNKVNIADIINNLTSTDSDKPLAASQGKVLNDSFKKDIEEVKTNHKKDIEEVKTNHKKDIEEVKTNHKKDIAAIKGLKYATFTTGGWSASAPFFQTVSVSGITADDTPVISLYIPSGTSAAIAKAQAKAWGYVDRGVTGAGNLTLYCLGTKPTANFQVMIKGV